MAKILFLSSEMAPFCKTGGLADVGSSLPKALGQIGHEVKAVVPYYHFIPQAMESPNHPFHIHISGVPREGFFMRNINDGIERYFVHHPHYYDREGIYGDRHGEFGDNDERFAYFSEAALLLCKLQNWAPDVVHINDWQTGILAPILKLKYGNDPFFSKTRIIFTIHNLAYQGFFPASCYEKFALPDEVMAHTGMEFHGSASFLKAGLQFSDFITTVSPTYAREIQTREFGFGMDPVIRAQSHRVMGILNAIDPDEWNPETDTHLGKFQFNGDSLDKKHAFKEALLSELQMPYWPHVPLLGMVSRFVAQKGIQLIQDVMEDVLHMGTQAVFLGSGDSSFVSYLRDLQSRYPQQIRVFSTFSNQLSHQIEAASDYFLMPSRYEPCGLNQMYSLRYGSIPIVFNTGGLADTVFDCDHSGESGNGYCFYDYNRDSFLDAIRRAIGLYKFPEMKEHIQRRGMSTDFSWSRSAKDYENLYHFLMQQAG